jgi:hypothetical protein
MGTLITSVSTENTNNMFITARHMIIRIRRSCAKIETDLGSVMSKIVNLRMVRMISDASIIKKENAGMDINVRKSIYIGMNRNMTTMTWSYRSSI